MRIKTKIKQWFRDFLHPIVWNDLGLKVIKRESDSTYIRVLQLMKDVEILKQKAELKNEIPAITRCDVVLEKQLKRLQAENERLKNNIELMTKYNDENFDELLKYRKENEELKKENEEINSQMSDVIYRATGGRLCYSNYTLDAIEQAFQDQLEILSDRKAEEVERENEELKKNMHELEEKFLDLNGKSYSYRKALEEISKLINETCWDYTDISIIPVKEKMLEVISEVLE